MTDLETRLRATFIHVAESQQVPPLPDFTADSAGAVETLEAVLNDAATIEGPTRLRVPRRRALVGIAALAILGGGLSVGAAAGLPVLPSSVVQALGWEPVPGAYNAIPATARLLLTEPGPDGRPLQLWGADANDNGYCVSFSAVVTHDRTAPHGFTVDPAAQPRDGVGAGSCGDLVGSKYWNTFGGELTSSGGPGSGTYTFIVRVAGAATVHLEFDDGTSRVLPIGNGYTAGWMTHRETGLHPVLVGLNSSGAKVGRVTLP